MLIQGRLAISEEIYMIYLPIIHIPRITIQWVVERCIQPYKELGLVEFYTSKMTAPEEFSLFCKIFTPDRDIPLGEANALLFKEQ